MNRKMLISLVLCGTVLLLAGCAGPIEVAVVGTKAMMVGTKYGFLGGLWHGFIVPWAFVGSWFSKNITIYAAYNTGVFYDLGFLLGIGVCGGGAATGSIKKGK